MIYKDNIITISIDYLNYSVGGGLIRSESILLVRKDLKAA